MYKLNIYFKKKKKDTAFH